MTTANPADFHAHNPAAATERKAVQWLGLAFAVFVAAVLVFCALFDWDWVRGPVARFASDATGRRVRIDGHLRVHLLTWTPTATVGGLKISQPAWNGSGDMAQIDQLVVSVRLMPLLGGHVVIPLLQLDKPNLDLKRDAQNRANWNLGKPNAEGGKLPPIQRFVVNDGHVRYLDVKRKLTILGTIDTNERSGGASAHAFSLNGEGSINTKPFTIRVTGGPLINVKLDAPYPFSGDVRAGDTHVIATGTIRKAFDLSAFTTSLHITGRDLADLYDLTGLVLPNTPVYDLHGKLDHAGKLYNFTGIGGRLGGSDLMGRFSVSTATGRPFVNAWLRSHVLDFKDLSVLFGAAPEGKGKAAAKPEQKAVSAQTAAQGRILPDAPLDTARLQKMDARLDYAAESVTDTFLPLRHAELKLRLDHGLLTADPLNFDFPQGRLTSTIALDGRGKTPVTSLDARLSNVDIKNFIPGAKGAAPALEGLFAARVKLTGAGDSVHRAAANANGAMTLVIPHGRMRQAFAELLGVNVGKGLSLLLSNSNNESQVRCGVAAFAVRGGQANGRNIVFDTDVVRVNGTGSLSLADESFDLTFKGDTKKPRLLHVFLPITVHGHWRSPQLGVQPGPAIVQGGLAAALGGLLSPLAAILPFVDPGLAKSADCGALMSEAKTAPAPVKAPLPVTPPAKK